MKIIETNLVFRGAMSNRSATRRIILHHAEAKTCSAQQIHQWHLANGWSGAGYHFLVRKDGSVYRLRPENKVGSHAKGANSDSIGICFEGNFMTETMSAAQINAGRELVAYLKNKYGITKVQRHKEVCSTNCPGTNFPFDQIVAGVKAGWVKDSKGWWYRNADGSWPKNKWLKLDAWYYFDSSGYAVTGWKKIGLCWYYFGSDCRMAKGWKKLGGYWYYLNPAKDGSWPEGSARTGWLKYKGSWYYLNPSKYKGQPECAMRTGWHQEKGKWYYLQPDKEGIMAANQTLTIDGKSYSFDASGAMK